MSLVLHIGLPKTGTTYIQRTFSAAVEKINGEIAYPDLGFYNHQLAMYKAFRPFLPWNAPAGSNAKWLSLLEAIREKPDSKKLISAEAFSALSEDGVAKLKRVLDGVKIDSIIITVRPLEKLLPSHWQQNLKNGSTVSLESYLNKKMHSIESGGEFSQMFAYYHTVKLWSDYFGDVNFKVLFMDGKSEQNLRMFSHLCGLSDKAIDILDHNKPKASEQNLSLTNFECEELLKINNEIKKGLRSEGGRKEIIQSFFDSKESGVLYDKPKMKPEMVDRAKLLDKFMVNNVSDYKCNVFYGSS